MGNYSMIIIIKKKRLMNYYLKMHNSHFQLLNSCIMKIGENFHRKMITNFNKLMNNDKENFKKFYNIMINLFKWK